MSDPNETHDMVVVKSSPLPWLLVVLLLAGAGVGYWLLDQKLQAAQADAQTAHSRVAEAQQKADGAAKDVGQLRDAMAKLNDENAILNHDREELERDVAAKNNELERLKGTYDELQDKMKSEIAKGDIQLSESGGKLRVDLVDKILFDPGDATISPRGQEVLQRVGAILAHIDDKQIQVSGHTDDSPIAPKLTAQFPTNWELSTARATNVVRFLNEKAGVPGKRLVASGYGPYQPIASNATPRGRAKNRRIEILLTPTLESVKNDKVVAAAVTAAAAPAPKRGHAKKPARKPVAHR